MLAHVEMTGSDTCSLWACCYCRRPPATVIPCQNCFVEAYGAS